MKAAVYHGPKDIRIEAVPEPPRPGPGWVTLDVLRAAICGTDASEWSHGPLLARPPVVLGHEFVGRVSGTGPGVNDLSIGDRVVTGAGVWCGRCEWCIEGRTNLCAEYFTVGLQVHGGLAEQATVPAVTCRVVPPGVGDDAAAMAQPLAVALHGVRRVGVRKGHTCAVIGVGGIGAFVTAAAAARGIDPLVALDIDDDRLARARQLGATLAVNVADRDIGQAILDATDGQGAHVVIEASGAGPAPAAALRAVARGGRVLLMGLQAAPRALDLFSQTVREVDLVTTLAHVCDVDLPEALGILERTELANLVLDRVISLDDLVEDGIRRLDDRTARGKIVVNLQPSIPEEDPGRSPGSGVVQ